MNLIDVLKVAIKKPPQVEYVKFDGTLESLKMIQFILDQTPVQLVKIHKNKGESGYRAIYSYKKAMLCEDKCFIFNIQRIESNIFSKKLPYRDDNQLEYVRHINKGEYVVLHKSENSDVKYYSVMSKTDFNAEYKV